MIPKKERDRRYKRKLKAECLARYGGVCDEPGCGVTDIDKLELHHPNGDGNKDRAVRIGLGLRSPGGWNFYQRLKREGYPEGYAVKCIRHHDLIHGRTAKGPKLRCAPGEDPFRHDDVLPF